MSDVTPPRTPPGRQQATFSIQDHVYAEKSFAWQRSTHGVAHGVFTSIGPRLVLQYAEDALIAEALLEARMRWTSFCTLPNNHEAAALYLD